jgi:hypothetical protein
MISRRLTIGLLWAGAAALALYATPIVLAFSPEARNAKLDETLRGSIATEWAFARSGALHRSARTTCSVSPQ